MVNLTIDHRPWRFTVVVHATRTLGKHDLSKSDVSCDRWSLHN